MERETLRYGQPASEEQPEVQRYFVADKVREQIENVFTYHTPKGDQVTRYQSLRDNAKSLAELIARSTPPSREQSLALTHLEEAIFFANAAIARHE